jgi:hypothetical protein
MVAVQHEDEAKVVLNRCQQLWTQEYIPPIFALIMHIFLLQRGSALAQSLQFMSVFMEGAENLFSLDVRSGTVCSALPDILCTSAC